MAISYTWDVSTVDTYPTKDSKADVIHKVHWRLKGVDGSNNDANGNPQTYEVYNIQVLDTSDLSSFTAFDSVSTSDVKGWLEATLGAAEVAAKKEHIKKVIARKVTPTQVRKTIS